MEDRKLMKQQNNDALRQLPFNGKKTVPRALRKDLWSPLATISFPPGHGALGLSAFQKLRELRKLHETFWDPRTMVESISYTDGTSQIKSLTRKERGRKLMDQKANSVADIAHVLGNIGSAKGDEIGLVVAGKRGRWEDTKEFDRKGKVVKKWVPHPEMKEVVVEVRWRDLQDAEFAETWEGNVIHDVLEGGRLESTYGEAIEAAETVKRVEMLEGKKGEQSATV